MNENICKGLTKKGFRCKNKIKYKDFIYCHIHKNNFKRKKIFTEISNELLLNICFFLENDLQSLINLSRTCKKFHKLFGNIFYRLNMKVIIDYVSNNQKKNKNDDFKSILFLYKYILKEKSFKSIFDILLCSYFSVQIMYYQSVLTLTHFHSYILIDFQNIKKNKNERIGRIVPSECIFSNIVEIIDFFSRDCFQDFKHYNVNRKEIGSIFPFIQIEEHYSFFTDQKKILTFESLK